MAPNELERLYWNLRTRALAAERHNEIQRRLVAETDVLKARSRALLIESHKLLSEHSKSVSKQSRLVCGAAV